MGTRLLAIKSSTKTYYAQLEANKIFGMVGRCGGGYNTVWEDWSAEGRMARERIMREYEEGLNAICGHYDKLEQSILAEGFRNPIIVTRGFPVKKPLKCIPFEIRKLNPAKRYLMEGITGGSRLWIAQKHNLTVPCLINDTLGSHMNGELVTTIEQATSYYKDPPKRLYFHTRYGISEEYDDTKKGYHLGEEWSEEKIIKQRAPLWVSIMNKYGYYVDRLQPNVLKMLADAGVVQSPTLKRVKNR